MQIEGTQHEVNHRPDEPRARGDGRDSSSIDNAIADYMASGDRDPWTVQVARRIFREDAEFFRLLGDR